MRHDAGMANPRGHPETLIPALDELEQGWREALADDAFHAELHALVPEESAPLFQHLPWLNRVWPMPRTRGRAPPGARSPGGCAGPGHAGAPR